PRSAPIGARPRRPRRRAASPAAASLRRRARPRRPRRRVRAKRLCSRRRAPRRMRRCRARDRGGAWSRASCAPGGEGARGSVYLLIESPPLRAIMRLGRDASSFTRAARAYFVGGSVDMAGERAPESLPPGPRERASFFVQLGKMTERLEPALPKDAPLARRF